LTLTEKRLQLDSKQGWQLSSNEIHQILSNQEKSESYDYLFKHGPLIKKKVDLLEQEIKQLKEKLDEIKILYLKYSNCVMDSLTYNSKLQKILSINPLKQGVDFT